MRFSWHGSASFSIKTGNKELLIDPSFSKIEDYGPWYMPNINAPDFPTYFKNYNPDYLFITHGHFDHFDLQTIKKIDKIKQPKYIGNPEVTDALMEYIKIPPDRLISIKPGGEIKFNDLIIKAYQGQHFLTGEEGSKAARKFKGRPDRYGVMPCGGPMLGYILETNEGKIYISGDTLLPGIPEQQVDVAIMYTGGLLLDPVTKKKFKSIIDTEDAVTAVEQILKPRFLIPVHYDFQYLDLIDINEFKNQIKKITLAPSIINPPYNTWVEVNI